MHDACITLIRQCGSFRSLAEHQIDRLCRASSETRFEPREIIVRAGDAADEFYLLRSGRAAVEVFTHDRGPITIQTVAAGDILGWSWLVEPFRWHFDAQATERTEAIAFDARQIRAACRTEPEFGLSLLGCFVPLIVARLQATQLQLLDVYHAPA